MNTISYSPFSIKVPLIRGGSSFSQNNKITFSGRDDDPTVEEIANTDDDDLFNIWYLAADLLKKINILKLIRPNASDSDIIETALNDEKRTN